MKPRKDELLTVFLFCAFLLSMMVCYLILPESDFSVLEKRYLKEKPIITMETVKSGELGGEIEEYMADHIPGRDWYIGLNSAFNLTSGRQITTNIRLLKNNSLVEAPVAWDQTAAQKNMASINSFAKAIDAPVDLMIVPSAGWASSDSPRTFLDLFSEEEYRDSEIISRIYALAEGDVNGIDVLSVLEGRSDCYYRTDHHWNSEGAYLGYCTYLESQGRPYVNRDTFTVEEIEGFYGSTYSRAALWSIPSESIELWHSESELYVSNGETQSVHEGPFYRERLEETDKYTVFLDGNHSIVRIENPELAGAGKILVIRDSYSNALGVFLAESYETVVLVDLRYYKNPISELFAAEQFDDVLICYSIGNFMTDTNFIWLR